MKIADVQVLFYAIDSTADLHSVSRSANVDLWPTILDLMGLPELEETDGHSLLPAIEAAARGDASDGDVRSAFAQLDLTWGQLEGEPRQMVAVTQGPWRLVYDEGRAERPELFEKPVDPREQRNVAHERPEVARELSDDVERYLSQSSVPWGESQTIEIDEMQMQQLRAIGYGVE